MIRKYSFPIIEAVRRPSSLSWSTGVKPQYLFHHQTPYLTTTSLNNLRKYTYYVSFKYTLLSITMPPTQDYHGHYKFRICTTHQQGKHMGVFWIWRTVAETLEVMVKWDNEDNWVVLKTGISWKAYEQRGGEGGQSFAMLVIPRRTPPPMRITTSTDVGI